MFTFDSCCSSRFRFISHSFRVMKFHGSFSGAKLLLPSFSSRSSSTRKSLHAISFCFMLTFLLSSGGKKNAAQKSVVS